MTPLQQLIAMALPSVRIYPNSKRADLLEEAARHLEGDLARACEAQAICLRNADAHQMKMNELLLESVRQAQ